MIAGFLLDEHLPTWWTEAIWKRQPDLEIRHVGDFDAPQLSATDPEILEWCESNDFILLTNNRSTMPGHLVDHLTAGRHVPGIFRVSPRLHVIGLADDLALIAEASLPGEFRDMVIEMPRFGP